MCPCFRFQGMQARHSGSPWGIVRPLLTVASRLAQPTVRTRLRQKSRQTRNYVLPLNPSNAFPGEAPLLRGLSATWCPS